LGSPAKKEPSGPYADKLWREALRRQVLKRVAKQQNLDRLAAVVFSKAMKGDMVAAKEIGERIDGKVPQAQIHTGHDGGPVVLRWEE
jgi:hypothetical protein